LSAESKLERRAKTIDTKDEFRAAEKLVEAAWMISAQPIALQATPTTSFSVRTTKILARMAGCAMMECESAWKRRRRIRRRRVYHRSLD